MSNATDCIGINFALTSAALVGKYVDLDRPSTVAEIEAGTGERWGIAGTVAEVSSTDDPDEAVICFDYGMAALIDAANSRDWSIKVYPDEATAIRFQTGHSSEPAPKIFLAHAINL